MKKLCSCLLLVIMPASVWAQSTASTTSLEDQVDATGSSRWRLGLGVAAIDNGYVGQGAKLTPIPLVSYEGQHFFFRGITAGIHLLKSDSIALDAVITPGFGGINASDFSRADLARRGINRDSLQDRSRSIDAGLQATWKGSAGQLKFEATSDISGNSKGQEYSLGYGYALRMGAFTVTPSAGVKFLSNKVANYYYGILPEEVRRGLPNYRPGAALIPEIGVSLSRPIGPKWALIINAKYSELPNKISNSPLVDGNNTTSVFVGFSRAF